MKRFYNRYFSWKEVLVFSLLSMVSVGLVYIVPRINKYVIDTVAVQGNTGHLIGIIVLTTVFLFLIHTYMLFFPNFFGSIKMCHIEKKIRRDLISSYLSLPNYVYSKLDKAFLLNLFLSDTGNAASTLINFRVAKIVSAFHFIIAFIVVMTVNIHLGLIALIFVPLYFLALFLSRKNLYTFAHRQQSLYDSLVGMTDSIIVGKTSINNNNAESYFYKKHDTLMSRYIGARLKREFLFCILQHTPVFIEAIAPLIILIIGALYVQHGNMTIGTLVMCVQYVGMMFEPIGNFAQLLTQKTTQTPAFERLEKVLFDSVEPKSLPITNRDTSQLKIVGATINNDERDLLFSIDTIVMEDTGLYCIKGENGSGKTTLLNVLCMLYDPDCLVLRDAHSELELPDSFFSRSYLHHPHFLFEGTVKENITMGIPHNEEKLKLLCAIFGFEHFLDTEIKIKPVSLSDGEQQKVALIRTLLQDKKTYILDEPEKSLDRESIKRLHEYITDLKKDHLILFVSHTNDFDTNASGILTIRDKCLYMSR